MLADLFGVRMRAMEMLRPRHARRTRLAALGGVLTLAVAALAFATFQPSPPANSAVAQTTMADWPRLSLPFTVGTGAQMLGLHLNSAQGDVTNAVDFIPADGDVRAARGGTVRRIHCDGGDWVVIDHEGGWRTGYYHIAGISVQDGQQVERGEYLGRIGMALPCGGAANGPHVHFSLWRQSADGTTYEPVSLEGKAIGGWRIQAGTAAYHGTVVRGSDGARVALPGNVYNDGAVGIGPAAP